MKIKKTIDERKNLIYIVLKKIKKNVLTPKIMKLLGRTYSKIRKDKNGENVPFLEIIEVVLIHCTVFNNSYEQNSRALYTIVPNKAFGQF